MKESQDAKEQLEKLKKEIQILNRQLKSTRPIHPAIQIKKARSDLSSLADLPSDFASVNIQVGWILAKLQETGGALEDEMKRSTSEKLIKAHDFALELRDKIQEKFFNL